MPPADATQSTSADSLSHVHILRVLRRRWLVVLGVVALIGGAALAYSLLSTKQYTTTAKLLFRDPGFDQKLFGSTAAAPSLDPAREAATNVSLVSLETISARAARALGRGLTQG